MRKTAVFASFLRIFDFFAFPFVFCCDLHYQTVVIFWPTTIVIGIFNIFIIIPNPTAFIWNGHSFFLVLSKRRLSGTWSISLTMLSDIKKRSLLQMRQALLQDRFVWLGRSTAQTIKSISNQSLLTFLHIKLSFFNCRSCNTGSVISTSERNSKHRICIYKCQDFLSGASLKPCEQIRIFAVLWILDNSRKLT